MVQMISGPQILNKMWIPEDGSSMEVRALFHCLAGPVLPQVTYTNRSATAHGRALPNNYSHFQTTVPSVSQGWTPV